MFDYFTNSILAGTFWGLGAVIEAYFGKKYKDIALFLKFFIIGIIGILFFLFSPLKIINHPFWKKYNYSHIPYLLLFAIGLFLANFFYYSAHEVSGKKSHIVIAIMFSLSMFISIIGTSFIMNEKITPMSIVGIILMGLGLFVLKTSTKS